MCRLICRSGEDVQENLSVTISLHKDHRRMLDAGIESTYQILRRVERGKARGGCHWACVTGAGRLEGFVCVKDGENAGGGEVEASTQAAKR